jgi:hypothetical protein
VWSGEGYADLLTSFADGACVAIRGGIACNFDDGKRRSDAVFLNECLRIGAQFLAECFCKRPPVKYDGSHRYASLLSAAT